MSLNKSYLLAAGIAVALVAWMMAGEDTAPEQVERSLEKETGLFRVQYEPQQGTPMHRNVRATGHVSANRKVDVLAEVSARVTATNTRRGLPVQEGQLLLTLDERDLPARKKQAEAALKQLQIQVKGSRDLLRKGLTTETEVINAEANLASAEASLTDIQRQLDATRVRAPFSGYFDQRYVELGEYVPAGQPLVRILDTQPMLVKAQIAEKDIADVAIGDAAFATLLDGTRIEGEIRYIAAGADADTRSYDIEMAVTGALPEKGLFDGQTATLYVPQDDVMAYFLSPALLIMTEKDQLGLKVLGDDNRVEVVSVTMLSAEDDGVWVFGPGEAIKLITIGQGFVSAGEEVEAVAKSSGEQ